MGGRIGQLSALYGNILISDMLLRLKKRVTQKRLGGNRGQILLFLAMVNIIDGRNARIPCAIEPGTRVLLAKVRLAISAITHVCRGKMITRNSSGDEIANLNFLYDYI